MCQQNCVSKKIFAKNIFHPKKGLKNIFVQKNFLPKKLEANKFRVQINFGSKKFLNKKKCCLKQFWPKKIFNKKTGVKTNFEWKKIRSKNSGAKKFDKKNESKRFFGPVNLSLITFYWYPLRYSKTIVLKNWIKRTVVQKLSVQKEFH